MTTQKQIEEAQRANQGCIDVLDWLVDQHYQELLATRCTPDEQLNNPVYDPRNALFLQLIEKAKADIEFTGKMVIRLQDQLKEENKSKKNVLDEFILEKNRVLKPNEARPAPIDHPWLQPRSHGSMCACPTCCPPMYSKDVTA